MTLLQQLEALEEKAGEGLLLRHASLMARQMVDSSLSTTREFWRMKMGATTEEASDPRPFLEVIRARSEGENE